MKRLLAILLISLAAVAGTFIGTSLANQQTNIPVNNTANNTTANTTVNDDTVKILQEAKNLLQQVKDTLSKKEDRNSIPSEQSESQEATIGQQQSIKQEPTSTNLNKQVDTKPIEPAGSSTKLAEQSVKPAKSSTKPVVESNVANTVQPKPIDFASLFTPQKDITIEEIPTEITRSYKEVFKFVMTHPVDQSAEQIMLDSLPWVDSYFEKQIAANPELYENAKNALSEQDYKLYIWNKMRLEALEYLGSAPYGGINVTGLDTDLALDTILDDTNYDPNIYGEPEPDPTLDTGERRTVYKGVAFLLDKRLWLSEIFWKPFNEGETDFGYTTEIRIIGDLSLKDYTDQTLKEMLANYDVDRLINRINLWRKVDWDKIRLNEISQGEKVGDLHFEYFIIPNKYLPSMKIEVIDITRYNKDWMYFQGKSVEEVLKEQGK